MTRVRPAWPSAALHWAVVSKQTPTVKYILGGWGGAVNVADAEGNTPLHLVEDHTGVMVLLLFGTATQPSLTACNAAGQTPAAAAAAIGAAAVAKQLGLGC